MADLRWDEVRSFFDPDLMGAFPDVFVPDTSAEDWQRVFDLVEARGWQREFRRGGLMLVELRVCPVPRVLAIFPSHGGRGIERKNSGVLEQACLPGLLSGSGDVARVPRGDFRPVAGKRRRDQAAGWVVGADRDVAGCALPGNGDGVSRAAKLSGGA
ncbi:hypothetical protein ACFQ68_35430 [Amycolatopsis japonica]|uniref:hypothetical protein n=1 Tax=Amycolatopsis japonica TaxID=208439 RepID=UPI0036729EBA